MRNTAEGFWRFSHGDFARFMAIAKGSLGELFDSVDEACAREWIDAIERAELTALINRAIGASIGLHRYLTSSRTPPRRRSRGHTTRAQPDRQT